MSNAYKLSQLILLTCRRQALKKLVFSRPVSGDVPRIVGTLCRIGGTDMLQLESFHADNKATHENLALVQESVAVLEARIAVFGQVNLLTTAGDAEYRRNKKGNDVLLGADKLARVLEGDTPSVSIRGNNKEKNRILQGDEPFLRLLDVADANGRVFDKKQAKFRQINRFLELIRDTLPYLPKDSIRICDLCCGKSYLSFAVYHYFANILGLHVRMTGVDLKPDVVAHCNNVARTLGLEGLEFLCGDVGAYECEGGADLVISLHACDTATDLVLERALAFEAKVILATPCCHHELNHTLKCAPLAFLAEHSMLRQKFCDAATDALRLKWLQANGYEVAALELIDPENTPKNIMLRALRRKGGKDSPDAVRALREYEAARAFLLGE